MTDTTWAGRAATPPRHDDHHDDHREPRSKWLSAAGVVFILGLVGAGGYLLGTVDGDDSAESAQEVPPTTTVEAEPEGTSPPTTTPPTTAPATTTPPSTAPATTEPAPAETPDDDLITVDEGEVRAAVLRGGVLYLGGAVPNRDVADQIIERAAAVIGEENIVDQYVIDPTAPVDPGAPLYVEDVVLFAYGASDFDPQFTPLLDLGLLLLSQNPSVTLTVVTHTDSDGSDAYNQELSLRRGQSVAQYWIDRGIPAEQIVIDARGEQDPVADNNDPLGAQLNRRAEFYVEGILG
jgi:outer membrane protein OmpA-like peptidoglycan-associated protein